MTDGPDEIVTIAYCPACETPEFPSGLEEDGERVRCPRCGMAVSAEDFYDYADIRVVDYE